MRLASGAGSRAVKYRHLLDEALSLDDAELSLLAVLMLRGPQTAAELRQRTERLHHFDQDEVEEALARLTEREYAGRHPNRPGERGERYAQLLGSERPGARAHRQPPRTEDADLDSRVSRLEDEVARLWDALERRET